MRKWTAFLFFILMAGCSGGDDEVKGVAEAYYERMLAEDYAGVHDMIHDDFLEFIGLEDKQEFQEYFSGGDMFATEFDVVDVIPMEETILSSAYETSNFSAGVAEHEDIYLARVELLYEEDGGLYPGVDDVLLVNEDGEWQVLVVFSMFN
ncbi:hypothetical protein ACE1TF_13750 [Geomicrobium sp. JSM 1781026]|uniref:hypothetical protein n=1 Tax=Geomicrobium sp. JSM 1781026 TaxID=3344580 RepID=UPI0035C03168